MKPVTKLLVTRMHSSGMRTARLLTVSYSIRWRVVSVKEGCLPMGGASAHGRVSAGGVSPVGVCHNLCKLLLRTAINGQNSCHLWWNLGFINKWWRTKRINIVDCRMKCTKWNSFSNKKWKQGYEMNYSISLTEQKSFFLQNDVL